MPQGPLVTPSRENASAPRVSPDHYVIARVQMKTVQNAVVKMVGHVQDQMVPASAREVGWELRVLKDVPLAVGETDVPSDATVTMVPVAIQKRVLVSAYLVLPETNVLTPVIQDIMVQAARNCANVKMKDLVILSMDHALAPTVGKVNFVM